MNPTPKTIQIPPRGGDPQGIGVTEIKVSRLEEAINSNVEALGYGG